MTNEELLDQDFTEDTGADYYTLKNIKELMNRARKSERAKVIEELTPYLDAMYHDMERGAFCLDGRVKEDIADNVIESTSASDSLLISMRNMKLIINQLKGEG